MIDLKRNSKKEPVKATGLRTRASSSYSPNQKQDFKISRGRFSNFLTCKRCLYLDRVKGLDPSEEYFRKKKKDIDDDKYFPPEESEPPHY